MTTVNPKSDRTTIRTYDEHDLNDLGNAAHFAALHGERVGYCFAWKRWLVRDGCRWKSDEDGAPMRLAKTTVGAIFKDGLSAGNNQVMRFANTCGSGPRLREMLTLAQSELPLRHDEFDTNHWLLNCPNGTVDLRTGKLGPHARWQKITQLCPTDFNPTATAPTWERFLTEVFVDPTLISFVQRLLGYCLSGDVSEQKLPILFGSGANGKSTLVNCVLDVVGGDYSMQAMPDFLMERRGDRHPTEKASLFRKRLVSCAETEASGKLAESTVKLLTGGEQITARRMREDFWSFTPSHKILLCTNHRPVITGTDHGVWRRLLLIPFRQRFEGDAIDPQLPKKLAAESAGVLAWLVRGCLAWRSEGLNPPRVVTDATREYRSSEDVLGRFVDDCCVRVDRNASVRFKDLFEKFQAWASDSGETAPSKKRFGQWLNEQGFESYNSNGRMYRGLILRNERND